MNGRDINRSLSLSIHENNNKRTTNYFTIAQHISVFNNNACRKKHSVILKKPSKWIYQPNLKDMENSICFEDNKVLLLITF